MLVETPLVIMVAILWSKIKIVVAEEGEKEEMKSIQKPYIMFVSLN